MTRRAFLKKYGGRLLIALLPVALIVYTFYHVFGSSSGSLMTAPARRITDHRMITGEGLLFRNEEVLYTASPMLLHEHVQSGSKVSRGEELLSAYAGYTEPELADVQWAHDRLQAMIDILQASALPSGTTLLQTEQLRTEANRLYGEILGTVALGGGWGGFAELSAQMLTMLNRYTALTEGGDGLKTLLEQARDEQSKLLSGTPQSLKNEVASGYYYSREYVDGYEELYTQQALDGLDAKAFEALRSADPKPTEGYAACKLVYDYRWQLAVPLTSKQAESLETETAYTFAFPENGGRELTLTCSRLTEDGEGGCIAVFYSDEVVTDFVFLRRQSVRITVGSTTGYHVPEAAMREADGISGVYVLHEGVIRFRRVEVLYRGDGYYIVAEQGDRGGDYLALNDMMVTSREELYDGRIYQ